MNLNPFICQYYPRVNSVIFEITKDFVLPLVICFKEIIQ